MADSAKASQPDSGDGNSAAPSSQEHQSENKFQDAISAWRNIDLTKFVPELDTTATDIVGHQKEALVSRKELAQKTKDFRKLDDESKLTEVKTLLKSYQTFIDLITEHGKSSSSAFLRIYSSLSEAPDPYPLLEASVDALLTSEDTLPKITAENERLQQSIAKLTEQLDSVEQSLDTERTSRQKLESSREQDVSKLEASWKAVIDEKQDNWSAKEKTLEERIESQERLVSELKANLEVTRRLGQDETAGKPDGGSYASTAELEIVSSDLERTSQRLAEVEARNEQLRTELAQATSLSQKASSAKSEEDTDNARLRTQNSSLLRKLDGIRLEKESDSRKKDGRIKTLEKEAQAAEHDRDSLRQKLGACRDYDEIKQELEIFKSIEFSSLDDDAAGGAEDSIGANGVAGNQKQDTLEKLLMARNKKLSNEMAVLRVSQQDLQQKLDGMQQKLSDKTTEADQAHKLNATLEADLVKVQDEASHGGLPSSAMSIAGTYTSRHPSYSRAGTVRGGAGGGRTSPTSSIISGFDPSRNASGPFGLDSASTRDGQPAGVGGGSGILPMIQAQRDRFKQKNSQLEADLSKQYGIVSSLRQEVAALQKDNLNLYEKSRYVSTYSRHVPSSSPPLMGGSSLIGGGGAPSSASTAINIGGGSSNSVDTRYRSTYEANLSPLAAFRGREHTRAYKRMTLPERIVFSMARMVLANRTSRNVFAFYCLALHLLVFIMLYSMHGVDAAKSAPSLSDGTAAVAGAAAAADGDGAGPAAAAAAAGGAADAKPGDWVQEGFTG